MALSRLGRVDEFDQAESCGEGYDRLEVACCLFASVSAQGVSQTVPIAKVDVQTVAAGYRASKVIGSNVLNDANETIGRLTTFL